MSRLQEVREASSVLGVSHLAFLEYLDGDLDQAEEEEVVAKIVTLLRSIRPQVVITCWPEVLYGHPDHVAIAQFTSAAILCAADPNYHQNKAFI